MSISKQQLLRILKMKKLYTLNRQMADRETDKNIGDVESYFCTYDMEEMQKHIAEILHKVYVDNKNKPVFSRSHSTITRRGKSEPFKTGNVYAFVIHSENTKCFFSVEYHELQLSLNSMFDNDLM